jgi:hypothetical protein
VDSIVETNISNTTARKRGDLYFTKDMLLAVGDRYEARSRPQGGGRQVPLIPSEQQESHGRQNGLFYLFSAVLLFAAFRVITARNPVYAALYLVLAFFQAAAVWILLKAEFPRHLAGARLRRRRDGAVPVRGDDAGHQRRQPARRLLEALPAGRHLGASTRSRWPPCCWEAFAPARRTRTLNRRRKAASAAAPNTKELGKLVSRSTLSARKSRT